MMAEDRRQPTGKRDPRNAFVSGLILAAGRGERMRRSAPRAVIKPLLPMDDTRSLLECVIDAALASTLAEVVVVLGHEGERIERALGDADDPRLRRVHNPQFAAGQSSSLKCGLRALDVRAQGACVLLSDQPHVSTSLIDRIGRAFLDSDAWIVRPVHAGVQGHPVFVAREAFEALFALEGDAGARTLIQRHPESLQTVPVDAPLPEDVDTWQDYERLRSVPLPRNTPRSTP